MSSRGSMNFIHISEKTFTLKFLKICRKGQNYLKNRIYTSEKINKKNVSLGSPKLHPECLWPELWHPWLLIFAAYVLVPSSVIHTFSFITTMQHICQSLEKQHIKKRSAVLRKRRSKKVVVIGRSHPVSSADSPRLCRSEVRGADRGREDGGGRWNTVQNVADFSLYWQVDICCVQLR